jgi:cephalosporin-C deacetylase-like acetyl esterase
MQAFILRCLAGAVVAIGSIAIAATPVISLKPDHPTGIYALNENVVWTVDVEGDRTGLNAVPYVVTLDGTGQAAKGTIDLSAGPATITATRPDPGALVAHVTPPGTGKKEDGIGGAVFAPDQIKPSAPEPADFDAFWQSKLKELAAVPLNPVVEKVDVSTSVPNSDGVDYYKVTLDNIRGTHVYGQLARPTKGDKFPAMLMVQFAGVYPLDKPGVVGTAKTGWLAFNIIAHDIPIDQPDDYYANLKAGALKDYMYIGSEDKDTSYFLRMLLGCAQAVNYLKTRPDWDGKTIVVTGVSQGGLQSFATAALCPEITEVMTSVPAGADVYGPIGNPPRQFGWPYWLSNWGPKDRDMKKVQATAGYYDTAYFAARVNCPTLVGVGLLDETARPAGVIAAYNAVKGPKQLLIMPLADHHGSHNSQHDFFDQSIHWRTAIINGRPLPIPSATGAPTTAPAATGAPAAPAGT